MKFLVLTKYKIYCSSYWQLAFQLQRKRNYLFNFSLSNRETILRKNKIYLPPTIHTIHTYIHKYINAYIYTYIYIYIYIQIVKQRFQLRYYLQANLVMCKVFPSSFCQSLHNNKATFPLGQECFFQHNRNNIKRMMSTFRK